MGPGYQTKPESQQERDGRVDGSLEWWCLNCRLRNINEVIH